MGKSVVRFKDPDVPHCGGMTREGKSPNVFANGKGVSRQGDVNTTHLLPPDLPPCDSHSAGITTGSTTVFTNNKGTGRTGDAISGCTACGDGSTNVFAGG